LVSSMNAGSWWSEANMKSSRASFISIARTASKRSYS
jgi:hypothetical protein